MSIASSTAAVHTSQRRLSRQATPRRPARPRPGPRRTAGPGAAKRFRGTPVDWDAAAAAVKALARLARPQCWPCLAAAASTPTDSCSSSWGSGAVGGSAVGAAPGSSQAA
eukprot:EG_transcript_37850